MEQTKSIETVLRRKSQNKPNLFSAQKRGPLESEGLPTGDALGGLGRVVPGIGLCIRYIRLFLFSKTRGFRAVLATWLPGDGAVCALGGPMDLLMYPAAPRVFCR